MPLKILQLLNRIPWPVKDGGAMGFYNTTKGLHEAGCEVTVAAFNTSKHFVEVSKLPPAFTDLCDLHTVYIDNRVKPVDAFINLFTSKSYNAQRFESKEMEALLVKLLSEKQFDLILFDGLFMSSYIDVARKYSKAKMVLREHNVEWKIWQTLADTTGNVIKKKYLQLLADRLRAFEGARLDRFDAIITLTTTDKDELSKFGSSTPIYVIPGGVQMQPLKQEVSPEPFSVFHLGSMDWMPNQDSMKWFIKEVWPGVVKEHPKAVFYMAGKDMPESFKALETANIKVVGEVDNAILFMQSKQIMIVPLFAGSGIRIKILEGMSLGKTIVSTTLGAMGIECDNGVHVVIANTAAEFTTAVNDLLSHPEKADQIGQNAMELARSKYDLNKAALALLNFYNQKLLP